MITETTYHKIDTVFKRNPEDKWRTLLDGEYCQPEFQYLANNKWVLTEKVDGTNVRVHITTNDVVLYGRTNDSQIPDYLATALDSIFAPIWMDIAGKFPDGICLYGEGYGPKIQSGGKYRNDHSFVMFDARTKFMWLPRADVEDIADQFGINIVPVVAVASLVDMVDIVRSGFKSQWGDFTAEGVVARPETELRCQNGSRLITKLKHRDFL